MMKTVFALILCLVLVVGARCADRACSEPCKQGNCQYKDCTERVECSGGACHFLRCIAPSCVGGSCTFEECAKETCEGGGCTFVNPRETLVEGYCTGENCNLEGVPHPIMTNLVSV